jgi:hypothetical protein
LEYERQEEALGELLDGILATLKEGYNWELAE